MEVKKRLFMLAVVGMLVWVGNAWAVTITYTGDNIIDTWYRQGDTGAVDNLSAGANRDNWRIADTAVFDLAPGSNFTFVWQVTNYGAFNANNPAGFLAQIDLGAGNLVLTDKNWRYAEKVSGAYTNDFNSGWNWASVEEYGNNGASNIWTTNNGGMPVAGISELAQWIWSENNFANGTQDNLFIRVDVATAPVPEPGTLLLLGGGLLGLVYLHKRKKA